MFFKKKKKKIKNKIKKKKKKKKKKNAKSCFNVKGFTYNQGWMYELTEQWNIEYICTSIICVLYRYNNKREIEKYFT